MPRLYEDELYMAVRDLSAGFVSDFSTPGLSGMLVQRDFYMIWLLRIHQNMTRITLICRSVGIKISKYL